MNVVMLKQMNHDDATQKVCTPKRLSRRMVLVLIMSAVALIVIANAHLVYVAITSQPDCVAHFKDKSDELGRFRAARSSC